MCVQSIYEEFQVENRKINTKSNIINSNVLLDNGLRAMLAVLSSLGGHK